jgi:toxin ParE1/3/4
MSQGKSAVIWSPEATEDIDHLWDYYADVVGHTAADNILREIARAVATIDDFPLAGRSRDDVRAGLRSLAAGSQIVFYRLRDDRPQIVRVLDSRRDIDEIFSDEEGG